MAKPAITPFSALFIAFVALFVAFFYGNKDFTFYLTELGLTKGSASCSSTQNKEINEGIAPGFAVDTTPLDYSLLEKFVEKNSKEKLKWGTYRSGLYYGLRSRTYPYFVSGGLLWQSQHEDLSQMRHLCRQEDRLQKYGWLKHDGKQFGMQKIEDQHNRIQLKTFYTRFLMNDLNGWGARFQVTHLEPSKAERFQRIQVSKTKISLFFYIDLGCEDDSLEHTCRDILKDLIEPVTSDPIKCQTSTTTQEEDVNCQQMEFTSYGVNDINPLAFRTIFQLRTKKTLDESIIQSELRFTGLKDVNLLNVREKLIQLGTIDPTFNDDQFTKQIYLDNMMEDGSTMVIVQAIIEVNDLTQFDMEENVQLDILFHENPDVFKTQPPNLNKLFTTKMNKDSENFDTKFDQVFQLSSTRSSSLTPVNNQVFNKSQIDFAQAAFSNLLGGMSFFYGSSLVQLTTTINTDPMKANQVMEIPPKPLFTAVPSRSFFPRGFLWDEGFHQMGISPFDLEITQDAIVHWMQVMLQDGYIPREQILGHLARSRVPKEFLVQHETHANPPSLLLCIEKILYSNSTKHDMKPFLQVVFPFLKRWYQWLIVTQRGPSEMPGTFRWRGRSLNDGKLIANTLSSGLDDYPRASVPSEKEIHVDLIAWMAKLSDILARITNLLDPKDPLKQVYLENKKRFLQAMDKYHWHEETKAYFDYGLHSEDGRIESQVVVRCRNEAGHMKDTTATLQDVQRRTVNCPSTHPSYLYPLGDGAGGLKMQPIFIAKTTKYQHVQHVGYVSIFPLLLKLLPQDSPRLLSLLNLIRDPKHLWTPFGLRSLSTKDPFYEQENAPGDRPYWRGSLWININYLALDALYHYSHHVQDPTQKTKFQETYVMLRQNVMDTIYREYERTGYLWEQYNGNVHDQAHYGQGQRCHPFSGWTALVVNIMAEKFSY